MGDDANGTLCHVFLLGCLSVTDADGHNCTPKSQKARALIAMLVLAPRGARSRVWLRDKLWSDRGEEQAAASLRQALVDIRKALGPVADRLLVSDNHTISLDLGRIKVDAFDLLETNAQADGSMVVPRQRPEFLEGFDIGDPEFEEWLTLERQIWLGRFENILVQRDVSPKEHKPGSAPLNGGGAGIPGSDSHDGNGKTPAPPDLDDDHRWRVALMPTLLSGADSRQSGILTGVITEVLLRALLDSGSISVTDMSGTADFGRGIGAEEPLPSTIPFTIQLRIQTSDSHVQLNAHICQISDKMLMWMGGVTLDRRSVESGDATAAYPLINEMLDRLQGLLLRRSRAAGQTGRSDSESLFGAVDAMFRLSRNDLALAEASLRKLIDQHPSSQAYAWLAFLMTFKVGQRFSDSASTVEEAQFYARKALEADNGNATAMALVGHVHSYLFGEYDFASGLFERAIRTNPAQVLAWDLYSMLHAYAGQPGKGLSLANWARRLGSHSPYRYYFDTSACINAALSGNHRVAIEAGEQALRERPSFNSLLRFLVSSHAHQGDLKTATALLDRLNAVEPNFSIGSLIDARYPIMQTEGGVNLIAGLRKAGVK